MKLKLIDKWSLSW